MSTMIQLRRPSIDELVNGSAGWFRDQLRLAAIRAEDRRYAESLSRWIIETTCEVVEDRIVRVGP